MKPSLSTPETTKPKLTWYQQVWIGWPIVLMFVGGAIGGLCGGAAWAINMKVFQSTKNSLMRYLLTGVICVLSIIIWFVVATFAVSLLPKPQ